MEPTSEPQNRRSGSGAPPGGWRPGSLLDRLSPEDREALLQLGVTRRYPPRTVLLQEGDRSSHIAVVRSGRVKVTATTEEGREVLLAMRTAGDVIGELAAMDGEPRSATVMTCGPVSCQEIGHDQVRSFLNRRVDAARILTGMVGEKLRSANRRRLELVGYPVRVRVARILTEFSATYGRTTPQGHLALTLTQEELAALAGAATVTVQVVLRELREQGIVTTRYREIAIPRPDALRAIAHASA
jgi:CRP/FNR family transcriptional regulator, cyclic AMP receptor protein